MRRVLVWALFSSLLRPISAARPAEENSAKIVAQNADNTADSAAAATGDDGGTEYTTFNDIKVPQMKDIEGEQFNETIKDGYW